MLKSALCAISFAFATELFAMLVAPAQAAAPGYVGTWGVDANQCQKAQDAPGAPIVFTANGYDQHEAHCTFTSIAPSANGWKINANCTVEGTMQTDAFTLETDDDELIITRGESMLRLKRCT